MTKRTLLLVITLSTLSLFLSISTSYAEESLSTSTTETVTDCLPQQEEPIGADYIKKAGRLGVGFSLGLTSGPLNVKAYILDNLSVQLTGPLGLFFAFPVALSGELDILYDAPAFLKGEKVDLAWQIGGGVSVTNAVLTISDIVYFININVGLQLLFKTVPMDLVFSYRPAIEVPPFYRIYALPFLFAVTTRYYF